ncbi:trimeric LpxA-like protein [Ramicandelaber brevisporus]|nr:trimeric LpxA-like protein [Ramicandelaber brevisporus]
MAGTSNNPGMKIERGALVCQDTFIQGSVHIGSRTVVHPRAHLIAKPGPIVIGNRNLICENVTIINYSSEPLVIGDDNVFEVGAKIEAKSIGSRNTFETLAVVASGTAVASDCVVGVKCSTLQGEQLADRTVVFGAGGAGEASRRTKIDDKAAHLAFHAKHLQYLFEILPRSNHIRESNA